jgi:hypothetical protein
MSDSAPFLKGLEELYPGGASSPWYIYAGLVLQANDRMDLLGDLFQILKDETTSSTDLIVKVRALREAQLKASVLIGFPKVSPKITTFHARLISNHKPHRASTAASHSAKRSKRQHPSSPPNSTRTPP